MPDNKYNIEMFQGDTFSLNLTVKNPNGSPKDLSNTSARMQIRPTYSSNVVTESLSTSNGEIIIDTTLSTISLEIPANRTAAIPVDRNNGFPPKTKYVYDLELVENGEKVSKLIFGEVTVFGEVTR